METLENKMSFAMYWVTAFFQKESLTELFGLSLPVLTLKE
jgi:hypothetical protein